MCTTWYILTISFIPFKNNYVGMYNNLLAVTLGTGSKNRLFYHLHTQFISMLVRIAVLNSLASKNDDTAGQLDMEGGV